MATSTRITRSSSSRLTSTSAIPVAPIVNQVDEVMGEESGEDDGNQVEDSRNPLDNPLILSEIASKLDFEHIKDFRLVNRFWMESTLPFWRRTFRLLINSRGGLQRLFCESLEPGHERCYVKEKKTRRGMFMTKPFCSFEKHFKGLSAIHPQFWKNPFQQSKILGTIYIPPKIAKRYVDKFEGLYWIHFGPHLKSLCIEGCVIEFGYGKEMKGLQWIFQHCPNLEELEINPLPSMSAVEEPIETEEEINEGNNVIAENLKSFKLLSLHGSIFTGNVELCKRFLAMAPNLTTLIIKSATEARSFLEALTYPVNPSTGAFTQLNRLKLKDKLLNGELHNLLTYLKDSRPKPKLEHLKLTIDPENIKEKPGTFRKIMQNAEGTLKSLKIKNVGLGELETPRSGYFDLLGGFKFSQLTRLHLKFDYGHSGEGKYYPIDFQLLRNTPNLKTFICTHRVKNYCWWEEAWITQNLTKLDLNGGSGWALTESGTDEQLQDALRLDHLEEFLFYRKFDSEALEILSKWMPKLRTLNIGLDEETFPKVLTFWPRLEELTLLEHSTVAKDKVAQEKQMQQELDPEQAVKIHDLMYDSDDFDSDFDVVGEEEEEQADNDEDNDI